MNKKLLKMTIMLVLTLLISIPIYAKDEYQSVKAKVITNNGIEEIKQENEVVEKIQNITVLILEGEYQKEEYNVKYVLSDNVKEKQLKKELKVGDKVLVNIEETDGEVSFVDVQEIINQNYIIYLAIIFIILIVAIGRKNAIKPILIFLIMLFTIYLTYYFVILKEFNFIITVIILLLLIGTIITAIVNKKVRVELSSLIISTCISGVLTYIFGNVMNLSGENLNLLSTNIKINISQVICLGVILSSIGINIYISSEISSILEKLKQENKYITGMELFKLGIEEGMKIFTKIISIPILMCLFGTTIIAQIIALKSIDINNELISISILYLLGILIGNIITVPITSAIYSILNRNKTIYKTKSNNILEGQRSLKL